MIDDLLKKHPLIPVATVDTIDDACWLSNMLLKNNIRILEVTLRTPVALEAVKVLKQEFKELVVGVGTILNVEELTAAYKAGADFGVSPGFLPFLVTQAQMYSFPYLPGVATISEAMQAASLGVNMIKIYPSESLGGTEYLKAMHAVMPCLTLCPSGGIDDNNVRHYQSLPFVGSVGMSQLANREKIKARDEDWFSAIIKKVKKET